MSKTNPNGEFTSVSLKERLSFGGGDMATNIAWGAMSTYIIFWLCAIGG